MRERGQLVKRGTLSEDGDIEFWEDTNGSTNHGAPAASKEAAKVESTVDESNPSTPR
jgi:protein import protein ZIM17